METFFSNKPRDFSKEVARYYKYVNLNSKLNLKQNNRFIKLFSNGKEHYMFLLLRIMNIYSLSVQKNEQLLNSNRDFANNILNYIFDPIFFSQHNFTFYQDPFQLQNNTETPDEVLVENDIDSVNFSANIDQEPELAPSPFDSTLYLKNFFDIHFTRIGDDVFFNVFYSYNENHIVIEDNANEYATYLSNCNSPLYTPYFGKYKESVIINDNFKTFIDNVFTANTPTPLIAQNQLQIFYSKNLYWTKQKRQIFHNYINNFGIQRIPQTDLFTNCLINFNMQFYEWSVDEDKNFKNIKLVHSQFSNEVMHFLQNDSVSYNMTYANDEKHCLSIGFQSSKGKYKKPNLPLIRKYIYYFTMNKRSVLDNLALDFVNSILHFNFSHKNTIIYGDYDKFYKWTNMFNSASIVYTNLIAFYPSLTPIQTVNLIYNSDDEIYNLIKNNAKEVNVVRSIHKYFLVSSHSELTNNSNKYTNYIDFPYGGEFYNYEPLSDVDRVEIVKLLIIHGWHLLNSAETTEKAKSPQSISPFEILTNHLENTDETRIPLSVLAQIYNQFIDSQKTKTELRKSLEEKGYIYNTRDLRNRDKEYLQILSDQAQKHFIKLDIPSTDKQKAFSCKLNPEFWNEISPERKKETEDKNAAEFNAYLKELAEKYAPFFVEEAPEEPINNIPLAGLTPPEKFKDKDLQ